LIDKHKPHENSMKGLFTNI